MRLLIYFFIVIGLKLKEKKIMYYKIVQITPRHREDVDSQAKYDSWLSTVKDGSEVLLQEFQQSGSLFDFNFEHWIFTKGRIYQDQYFIGGGRSEPFDPSTGRAKCWSGKNGMFPVFPTRILPIHSELDAHVVKEIGDVFISDRPLYEPLFINQYRHVFRADSRSNTYYKFMLQYPHSYLHDYKYSSDKFIEIFTERDIDGVKYPDDLVFCRSEYLRD